MREVIFGGGYVVREGGLFGGVGGIWGRDRSDVS